MRPARLSGRQALDVIRQHGVKEGLAIPARDNGLSDEGPVDDAGTVPNGGVLGIDIAVVRGQDPPADLRHGGTQGAMSFVEWELVRHAFHC
jgi:hypothetical protein